MARPTPAAPFNAPGFFTRRTPADKMDAMDDPDLHQTDWDDLYFDY